MTKSTTPPSPPPPLPNSWARTKYRVGFPSTLITELNMMHISNVMRESPTDVAPVSKSCKVDSTFYSITHQWLPTDFDINPDGKVKAKSYINNLHPVEHKEMYPVLEGILEKFLQMFEEVLGEMRVLETKKKRLIPDPYGWYGEDPPDVEDFSDIGDYCDYIDSRVPQPATVPEFTPPLETLNYDLRAAGRERPLQVTVKLANIELTPDNPKYEGGTWQVEGMANENIVATGIYY
ncbi:hypothetical protein BGZ88_005133 [Linnemannia elongata]|nr:hypothetical protein BGZ88_005133 [Linnemannia elongata]